MFKLLSYSVNRKAKPQIGDIGKPTNRKLVAEFPSLEEARESIKGKKTHVIVYPKNYLKELTA
jgi:hypothetical protein